MPAARAFWAIRAISSSIFLPVTIIRSASFVDDDDDDRHLLQRLGRVGRQRDGVDERLPAFLASAIFAL